MPPNGAPPPKSAAPPSARGGLLSALNFNNKSKLKSAKDRKQNAKKDSSAAPAAAGGDMMSALANRLKMRRKGISGDKGEKEAANEAKERRPTDTVRDVL